ncbi:uncharacterized protein LOC131996768 [Stomoxys calcitrans]|uniref:uncharacterized protein LOC131994361 n=1 Tax=Stomoxys calcitrans TaxID=35570 RepID=UPI0027E319A7|nr:uncharacterized protein LOC131994361 [Stomoxys calcitrans]XP_059218159.1 uncharacterized protein LOC131994938 [Stomoxys calcitrans]XP_059222660.1 uncharacterized protein LOC131996768 [Stomoxys calcitrans]
MASKDFMIEFFDVLKNENAIWQTKSEKYKDKLEKQKSWEKLVTKWKEVDKNASVDLVKKKYNCLRTTYRRELQKMRKSERSGAGAEDIYVPSLWYFDHLNFLLDQETQLEGISTFDETFDAEIEKEPKKKKFDPTDFLETAVDHLKKTIPKANKDEADIYGEAWAVTFRKLRPEQKIYAKKVMDEALVYAQLGNLTLQSSVSLGQQQVQQQVYLQVQPRKPMSNFHHNNQNSKPYASASSTYSSFSAISPHGTPSPSPVLSTRPPSRFHFSDESATPLYATPTPSPAYSTVSSHHSTHLDETVHIIPDEVVPSENAFQQLFDTLEYE